MHYQRWMKSAPFALLALSSATIAAPLADPTLLSASEAAKQICTKQISSRELLDAYLARIDSHQNLNAFITVDMKAARLKADAYDQRIKNGEACLPLGGVPIAIKDNIQVVGFPNTAGTPALKAYLPTKNAPIIAPLESAGAIIVGKANMQELAYGTSGYNTAFHVKDTVGVRNAYDQSRIAGGSSSGSASAVGARLVAAALGTDTGGSVRQPAALNGIVGLRPTVGRYSQTGITPISPTRDTAGPMARTVADVILMDSIITGEKAATPPKVKEIRLGVPNEFWGDLSPEVAAKSEAAIKKLKDAGVKLVPLSMPDIHALNQKVGMPMAFYEGRKSLEHYLSENQTGVELSKLAAQISSPDVKVLFEKYILPQRMPGADGKLVDVADAYKWATEVGQPEMKKTYTQAFKEFKLDALIFPTTPDLAIQSNLDSTSFQAFGRMIKNTDPGSNAGLPGISLPIGLAGAANLPVGIELDSLPGTDKELLALALMVEKIVNAQTPPTK